jgi:Flp pilus assembly protein TadD
MSVRQTRVWRDSETLYRHTLAQAGNAPLSEYLHARLAHALFQNGRPAEALSEYASALQLDPNLPEAHEGMALALGSLGRTSEAITHYRAALRGKPDSPASLNNLAWLLATHPDPNVRQGTQAVALAERACALTQYRKPTLIGTLAAAYAEAGRFPEAIESAQKAEALATAAGDTNTAARNRELLELYRRNQPYREPAATSQ